MERTDFKNWSQEDIKRQLDWLYSVPPFTVFTLDKAICFGDGEVRIAAFKEDKTWSSWETYDAPNLHVTEGKFVFNHTGRLMPIIRISTDEAIEICSTDADPWTDDDAANCFNDGMGSFYVGSIAKGKLHRIELLTTRSTNPGYPIQVDIYTRMKLMKYNLGEERYNRADVPYQSDEWVKYYPYEEGCDFWVPVQEIAYLQSLLKKLDTKPKEESRVNRPKVVHVDKEAKPDNKRSEMSTVKKVETSCKTSEKSYKVAALLAIVLGGFGAHKFYMGKYILGLVYLVFSWTWIPGIIGVLEGLSIFFGGQEKFESKLK